MMPAGSTCGLLGRFTVAGRRSANPLCWRIVSLTLRPRCRDGVFCSAAARGCHIQRLLSVRIRPPIGGQLLNLVRRPTPWPTGVYEGPDGTCIFSNCTFKSSTYFGAIRPKRMAGWMT